jgi:class 3 adenylate cyclase
MSALQTTAILKTDLKGSTPTFRALQESDLGSLLTSHREFVARIASARGGRIVKPEGDGFWIMFPSVTAAALAAMDMQEELQLAQPNKGDDRVSMRIVITLGDVLNPVRVGAVGRESRGSSHGAGQYIRAQRLPGTPCSFTASSRDTGRR